MKSLQIESQCILPKNSITKTNKKVDKHKLTKRLVTSNKNRLGTLEKLLTTINSSLSESTLIKPIESSKYSININRALNKSSINEIKRMNYIQHWYPSCNAPFATSSPSSPSLSSFQLDQPITSNENMPSIDIRPPNQLISIFTSDINPLIQKPNTYFVLMLDNPIKKRMNSFSDAFTVDPSQFKSLSKKLVNSKIIKKSIAESLKHSPIRSFANKLHNNIEKYLHYAEKYSNIYEFDEWIRRSVFDSKTGISIPGNVLNCFNNTPSNRVNSIKVFQPSNVKEKPKFNLEAINSLPFLRHHDGRFKKHVQTYKQ